MCINALGIHVFPLKFIRWYSKVFHWFQLFISNPLLSGKHLFEISEKWCRGNGSPFSEECASRCAGGAEVATKMATLLFASSLFFSSFVSLFSLSQSRPRSGWTQGSTPSLTVFGADRTGGGGGGSNDCDNVGSKMLKEKNQANLSEDMIFSEKSAIKMKIFHIIRQICRMEIFKYVKRNGWVWSPSRIVSPWVCLIPVLKNESIFPCSSASEDSWKPRIEADMGYFSFSKDH